MNRCNDNLTGAPSFTIATHQEADGTFSAKCESIPSLPMAKGRSEAEAMRALKVTMEEKWLQSGGR